MEIKEITHPGETERKRLEELLKTLSSNSTFSVENLERLLRSAHSHLYGLYDNGALVGCCCLGIYYSLTGKKACLEDVVVLPEYQGRGGGRMLVTHATEEAQRLHAGQLQFTSKPARTRANQLYQSMGFERKETNVYLKKW